LTNIRITIFRQTYPENNITEDDQNYILEELGRVLRGDPVRELPHLKSYTLERGTDWDSHIIIKVTSYIIITGLSQVTIKALMNPGEKAVLDRASISEGEFSLQLGNKIKRGLRRQKKIYP
jgi:hypothetical protein